MNFDRDDVSGQLFSCEIAIAQHQERCQDERQHYPEVAFSLDPDTDSDWLQFFQREFKLQTMYELWRGDEWLGNVTTRPKPQRGVQALPIYSLCPSCVDGFAAEVSSLQPAAGCLVIFRHGPPDKEPFGMWLFWFVVEGTVYLVDVQNSRIYTTIAQAVQVLQWTEGARDEVFYAQMRSSPNTVVSESDTATVVYELDMRVA
eukprot:CAMPEP_0175869070 /NCGR_PEP_ID=MMETSP0107_2-20121207/35752_1 /TAXON_ID=195067 ORGANISM="Goniomonas pacifica, Strain CCMP1869" /NCGR_SAMPLE_ID=MMETSP0107_2 /ASSEMBLY_ACC=CAM_ASM_000203 /LENGTH=201 /DNA_ID=CAMNT_0017187051 /DNA_START=40 /DNA_END=646 /DNA_ORIENTATION=-